MLLTERKKLERHLGQDGNYPLVGMSRSSGESGEGILLKGKTGALKWGKSIARKENLNHKSEKI